MKFLVVARSPTAVEQREVSKEQFDQLLKARADLLEVLCIEEKFDMVMENYCEFEEEILSASVRYVTFANDILEMLHRSRLAITRRLANLLTTCRMYLEQSDHHLTRAFGASSQLLNDHKAEKSSQYDKHLQYRMMEALRNYAQHRGYPFQDITFSSSMVEPKPGSHTVAIIMPKLSIADIEEDGGFKPQVLEEIREAYEPSFDLRPHIRQYLDCLHSVQSALRDRLHEAVASTKEVLYAARVQFRDVIPEPQSIWALELIAQEDAGEETAREFFAFHTIQRYDSFTVKNRLSRPLKSIYVSGQIEPPYA